MRNKTELFEQMSQHGRIGAWEVNLEKDTIYWLGMTREIHEVNKYFTPEISHAINFYKEGESRHKIKVLFECAMKNGES